MSSIALVREGETLMFDCGEGTQRQMMRYGVSFALNDIFFTHLHGDHVIGVIGLFRTLALQGRDDGMRLWGPKGTKRVLREAAHFGVDRVGFPIEIVELEPGAAVARAGYEIIPFATSHRGVSALGYALVEEERRGRFNPDLAREMGIPVGPLWGQIHKGMPVTLEDGRVVHPEMLVGPRRAGRKVVLTGDTRPSQTTLEIAQDADLLVHEATFSDEEASRAVETGHSTAREAAGVASRAGVKQLVLTHFSARYSRDASELEREAKQLFPHVSCARDGMEVDVPFADAEDDAEDRAANPPAAPSVTPA